MHPYVGFFSRILNDSAETGSPGGQAGRPHPHIHTVAGFPRPKLLSSRNARTIYMTIWHAGTPNLTYVLNLHGPKL